MVKSVLQKKLLRDVRHSAMQFIALMVLCVLGVFLFSGIDTLALMTQATNETYFQRNNLADFWISLASADRDALSKVRAIPGVRQAQARFSLDMETSLPGDATLNVTAYDGAMLINIPEVLSGEALETDDLRGCLIQEGFAQAQNLQVGDRITLRYMDVEYNLFIRGIVNSPEFVSVSGGMGLSTDLSKYGYVLVNARAFADIPLTQIVVTLEEGADTETVRQALSAALPSAFILGQDAHESTVVVRSNAQMFRSVSIVFPLAAYAVAALIVMTTLTRMMDKERQQIGTLRALGYTHRQIRGHYLSYAIWPSLIGSLIGVMLGHWGVPATIWDILVGQNEYPFLIRPAISVQSWCMTGLTVVISTVICLITYGKTTRESAASLLRPKPPKDGRKLLLERVRPLWRRLDFNGKMVFRNLARSKMRTLVSTVGLICCNALLIASLGLQDSVQVTIDTHYHQTIGYNVAVSLNSQAGDADAYKRRLDAEAVECVMESSLRLTAAGGEKTTSLTVVEDGQQLLRLGPGGVYVPLMDGGMAVTEKVAEQLDLQVGDTVSCQLAGDDQRFTLTVNQIVENNLAPGVYLTRTTWEGLRKGAFTPTAIYLLNPSETCLSILQDSVEVDEIDTTENQAQEALIFLNTISVIFVILMIIALLMAFVICYNMGLINFAERTREYATLKVLGYHQKEIRRLILRENTLITLAAIAISIAPGIGFTGVILNLAESENLCYVVHVTLQSIVLGSVITALFSMVIQRLLTHKVRSIVMVEALKSVE